MHCASRTVPLSDRELAGSIGSAYATLTERHEIFTDVEQRLTLSELLATIANVFLAPGNPLAEDVPEKLNVQLNSLDQDLLDDSQRARLNQHQSWHEAVVKALDDSIASLTIYQRRAAPLQRQNTKPRVALRYLPRR